MAHKEKAMSVFIYDEDTAKLNNVCPMGHFRVPKALTFKMRPSAQPFL